MMQTHSMIQTFEKILDDSITQGISIFKNPSTRKFIKNYQNELSNPNAFKNISDCVEENRIEYKKRMGEIPSQLDFDIESLNLAHYILANQGETAFEQIDWLK